MPKHPPLIALAIAALVIASVSSVRAEKPRRVKVHAQPRPGAPAEDIDMRVHAVPTELTIVPADSIHLPAQDIVVGVVHEGVVVAYPVRFLSQHEVVSDVINGLPIAPTWCAITGSAVVYRREIEEREVVFDFGEGLINDNLLFADRETDSVWSQLGGIAIAGPHKGTPLAIVPAMQVTWRYWRGLYPETRVWLPEGEGHPYFYRTYRPGDPDPQRPAGHDTSRLGLGLLLNGNTMFFPLSELSKAKIPAILSFGEREVAIYYDAVAQSAWAINPDLELLPAVLVYDWAWADFFPDTAVFRVDAQF